MATASPAARASCDDGVHIPVLETCVSKPDRASAAWYAGLTAMAALELIEWPVAMLIGVSHALSNHAHNPEVREAAAGVEAGA